MVIRWDKYKPSDPDVIASTQNATVVMSRELKVGLSLK
jgi:hypothetical protein